MSGRRPYVYLAGDLSGYPKGFVPTPAWGRNLDQFSSELVNGDEGGDWSPETPIVIGPHGTPTITLDTVGSVLSGDIETVKGNQLDKTLDATPGLVLAGGAVPNLASAISRVVVVPFAGWVEGKATGAPPAVVTYNAYYLDPTTLGLKNDTYTDLLSISHLLVVSVPLPVRAQHRAATLDQIDVRVAIAGQFRTLPGTMMNIRVVRVRGGVQAALHSNAGGYDADGWLVDTAATVATFTNNGEPRTLSYVPNQNNGPIDPTQDFYLLQMRGASVFAGSSWLSATANLSGIADYRQE